MFHVGGDGGDDNTAGSGAERHVDPRVAAAVEARQQQARDERVGCKQAELVSRHSPGGATLYVKGDRFTDIVNSS